MNNKKTALITGGGSGIGRELCHCFYREGYNLVVVSLVREELVSLRDELRRVSDVQNIFIVPKDLSDPDAGDFIYDYCEKEKIDIDVLVNNVGFGLIGRHLDLDPALVKRMLTLNMMTMTLLCHLFGRKMKERGKGSILNVASTISFQPLPFWAAYAGSKAYVSSFSLAFAREMKEFGVSVICLFPGITATNFLDTAGLKRSTNPLSVGSMIHRVAMDAKKVARAGYRGMIKRKLRAIPGISNRLHFFLIHWIPNRLILFVVYVFMKRYRKTD